MKNFEATSILFVGFLVSSIISYVIFYKMGDGITFLERFVVATLIFLIYVGIVIVHKTCDIESSVQKLNVNSEQHYNVMRDDIKQIGKKITDMLEDNVEYRIVGETIPAEVNAALITEEKINELGAEDLMPLYCEAYRVPYDLCMAIAVLETGWFKSDIYLNYNNPGGLMQNGEPMKFETVKDGVKYFIENLYNNYFSKGYDTPEKIGPIYCPGPDRYEWIEQVNALMDEM